MPDKCTDSNQDRKGAGQETLVDNDRVVHFFIFHFIIFLLILRKGKFLLVKHTQGQREIIALEIDFVAELIREPKL